MMALKTVLKVEHVVSVKHKQVRRHEPIRIHLWNIEQCFHKQNNQRRLSTGYREEKGQLD